MRIAQPMLVVAPEAWFTSGKADSSDPRRSSVTRANSRRPGL